MDRSRYWMQKERSNCLNSHVFGDSWEEQAFAEDAAGPLGGCIWPPRSYTCSFCRREFRSAQALGGHMNVHRRDRARLKQISSPNNNNQVHESTTSLGGHGCMLHNPNEICNPIYDLDHADLFSTSSPTPSILRPFTCSITQEQQIKSTAPILSCSKFEPRKRFLIAELGKQEKDCIKVLESNSISTSKKNDHAIEVHIPGNLNSLVRKRWDIPIINDKDHTHDGLIFKRRRTDQDDAQSFFPKNGNLVNGDEGESTVPLKRSPNSTLENLDLELRLGDRP